jgi:hypothetical protein
MPPLGELDAVDPTMARFEFLPLAHTERLGPGQYPNTRRMMQPGEADVLRAEVLASTAE